AAAAGAGLLDRCAAAVAGLAGAAVDAELVLHPPAGVRPVAEIGPLAPDAEAERPPDALAEAPDLVGGEVAGRPQRMDPRMPERLVGVDVPEPGDGPLVEDRGLDRRLPAGESLREVGGREPSTERLRPEPYTQVRLGLILVEQEPRTEAAEVAVGDPRAVVELEHGPLVAGGLVPEPAGHPQVHEQHLPAGEADDQVLAPPLDRVDAFAGQSCRRPLGIVRARQPRIVDPGGGDAPA